MGTASPPPAPPRPPAAKTAPGAPPTPAGGTAPLPAPQATTTSRFHFDDKPVAMGPSGTAILGTIVALAVGAWLYFKPPSSVGEQALQRYSGFEANMETVVLKNCAPPGCAAVYLTPGGKKSPEALAGAIKLSADLEAQGIEFYIILASEPIADGVKRARGLRRPVVFDPHGDWGRDSGIEKGPYWIAWRTGGKIRLRTGEAPSAADVANALR